MAGGNSVKLVLNLQNFQVSVVNSLNIALRSPSTAGGVDNEWGVRWRAYSMDGVLVGVGNVPLLTNDVEGDDVAHLDESLPWLGKTDISKSNLSVDDMSQVLLYKFEFDYLRVDRLSATTQATTASNMYLLTDPSISVRHHRQARFSLLGAMRKVVPRVDLYVQCRGVTSDEEVEKVKCTLQNPVSNIMAIMTKLTLLRDSPPGSISADNILPAFFSNNYITLIPGEIVRVDILVSDYYEGHVISSEKDQIQGHDNLWQCNDDGYMTLFHSHLNSRGDSLLVSVDGWNVLRKVAPIECEPLVFAG